MQLLELEVLLYRFPLLFLLLLLVLIFLSTATSSNSGAQKMHSKPFSSSKIWFVSGYSLIDLFSPYLC
jgi:hypothetical protein